MGTEEKNTQMKVETGEYGYVLEDVPHLTDYIDDLPVSFLILFMCMHVYIVSYICICV